MPLPDMRVWHLNHPRIRESRLLIAINHIASFPTQVSHYTRKDTPDSRYLEASVKNKRHIYIYIYIYDLLFY